MKTHISQSSLILSTLSLLALFSGVFFVLAAAAPPPHKQMVAKADAMPYLQAGLSRRQAAAHLLSRWTWGVRPEDIDAVERVGLEQWFETQLRAAENDELLRDKLKNYKTLKLTNAEIAAVYPPPGKVLLELMRDGKFKNIEAIQDTNNKTARREALKYAYEQGYRPQKELLGEMVAAKLLRAVYSNNQLQDVVADFWMNHFSVSMLKTPARAYIPTYERDVMRPSALGNFHDLLIGSAQHPAMLIYLDNAQSTAPVGCPTLASIALDSIKNIGGIKGWFARRKIAAMESKAEKFKQEASKGIPDEFLPRRGINENYARELLELHTMGVDGGYSQHDVSDLARVLSGWTMMPLGYAKNSERLLEMIEKSKQLGTVVQGDFLFRADAHDATAKSVLGTKFASGGGIDEGQKILRILSEHASTARHIARKLCIRFVSDQPSEKLVQQVAQVFIEKKGDIKEMLRCIVYSPEFWSSNVVRSKIKTPFELAVSALRTTHAELRPTKDLYDWVTRLGQQLYAAPAPTGFADQASAWVNSGALLNRMNFGVAFAHNELKGVVCPLQLTSQENEAESMSSALSKTFAHLLPERDVQQCIALLSADLQDPEFSSKVRSRSQNRKDAPDLMLDATVLSDEDYDGIVGMDSDGALEPKPGPGQSNSARNKSQSIMSASEERERKIIALVLGSPEFQRR